MEEEYAYNQTGSIKMLSDKGFGYICPDEHLPQRKDVFFHITALKDVDIPWEDISIGQKVEMGVIIKNPKGYQAEEVTFLKANSKARSAHQ